MLQNNIKRTVFFILLNLMITGLLLAQSATADLTKRFLQKADDQYSEMQYEEAFKTINAALKLSERDEVPGNVYLLATQIYTKLNVTILLQEPELSLWHWLIRLEKTAVQFSVRIFHSVQTRCSSLI